MNERWVFTFKQGFCWKKKGSRDTASSLDSGPTAWTLHHLQRIEKNRMRSPTVSSLTRGKVGHEVSVSLLLDLLIIAVGVEEKSEDFADSESQ